MTNEFRPMRLPVIPEPRTPETLAELSAYIGQGLEEAQSMRHDIDKVEARLVQLGRQRVPKTPEEWEALAEQVREFWELLDEGVGLGGCFQGVAYWMAVLVGEGAEDSSEDFVG